MLDFINCIYFMKKMNACNLIKLHKKILTRALIRGIIIITKRNLIKLHKRGD